MCDPSVRRPTCIVLDGAVVKQVQTQRSKEAFGEAKLRVGK